MHPISIIIAISAVIFALPHRPHSHLHQPRQLGNDLSGTIVGSLTGALSGSGNSKAHHSNDSGCKYGFNNGAFRACINDCVALCVDGDSGCHGCFDGCPANIGCENEDDDGEEDDQGNDSRNSNNGDATNHRNSTELASGRV